MSSFTLSKRALIIIGGFVGVSLLAILAAVLAYGVLKVENVRLRSSLEAVQTKLDQANEEKEELTAQLLIVQGNLSSEEGTSKPSEPAPAKQAEPASPAVSSPTQENPPLDMVVQGFKLHKNSATDRVQYQFILRHKQPRKNAVSGYIFVLLKPVKDDATSWRISPKGSLQDGKPKKFNTGRLFSISRFKMVKGVIQDTEAIDAWEEAVVLVYASSGELVLEKVFEY